MYRITDFVSITDTMHFVVSNLVHRGGWVLEEAQIAGAPLASWPVPTDPTPALVAFDYAILKAPDTGLSECGDRVKIEMQTGPDRIDFAVYRLDGGASLAWVAGLPGAAAGGVSVMNFSVTFAAVGPSPKVYLFSSPSTIFLAEVDPSGNSISSGRAFGYLRTAVLRDSSTSPVLGQGEDPYPACWFDTDNAKTVGPPDVLTNFGQGEVFDPADAKVACEAVVQFLANVGPPAQELHDQPVQYGGGVPVHLLTKTLIKMDNGSGTFFFRGTFPTVHITSRTVAESVLRVDRRDEEYLVPAQFVAVGPIN